jgi:hypothetical protein
VKTDAKRFSCWVTVAVANAVQLGLWCYNMTSELAGASLTFDKLQALEYGQGNLRSNEWMKLSGS